jgi:hypothetical protein
MLKGSGTRIVVAQPSRNHLDQSEVLAERTGLRDLVPADRRRVERAGVGKPEVDAEGSFESQTPPPWGRKGTDFS